MNVEAIHEYTSLKSSFEQQLSSDEMYYRHELAKKLSLDLRYQGRAASSQFDDYQKFDWQVSYDNQLSLVIPFPELCISGKLFDYYASAPEDSYLYVRTTRPGENGEIWSIERVPNTEIILRHLSPFINPEACHSRHESCWSISIYRTDERVSVESLSRDATFLNHTFIVQQDPSFYK